MLRIHPRHWTTLGNRSDIPDSRWNDLYEDILRQYMIVINTVDKKKAQDINGSKLYYDNIPVGENSKCMVYREITLLIGG